MTRDDKQENRGYGEEGQSQEEQDRAAEGGDTRRHSEEPRVPRVRRSKRNSLIARRRTRFLRAIHLRTGNGLPLIVPRRNNEGMRAPSDLSLSPFGYCSRFRSLRPMHRFLFHDLTGAVRSETTQRCASEAMNVRCRGSESEGCDPRLCRARPNLQAYPHNWQPTNTSNRRQNPTLRHVENRVGVVPYSDLVGGLAGALTAAVWIQRFRPHDLSAKRDPRFF